MNKKVLVAMGLVLCAGVTVSGAACWRVVRNGTFDESPCSGNGFSLTEAFVPAWDFAEVRETNGDETFRVLGSSGKRCGGATALETCEAALSAATSKTGWNNGSHGRMPGHQYLVATRGDLVQVVNGTALTIGAALAPIDSPLKAAVVAGLNRSLSASCERSVRRVENGFEVHLETDSCFGPRDEVIRVSVNGEITVVSAEHGPSTCVGAASRLRVSRG